MLLVGRAGILGKRLPQRQMLRLGAVRQPRGVGGEKSERGAGVLAVLGDVEVHAAHQVPCRIAALQELLHAAFGFGQLGVESCVQFPPQIAEHRASEVFRAGHGRGAQRQALQFLLQGAGNAGARRTRIAFLPGTERGDEARAELAPVGIHRRQRRPGFVRAKKEEPVPRSAFERPLQTQCQRAIEGRSGVVASQRQPAVRGETQTERGGVHVATLQLSRTKRGQTPSSGWIRQSGRPGSSQP